MSSRTERSPICLVQPDDRGTAAAILWAAHVIRRREPDAVALVFPSDHYVDGKPTFMSHVLDVAAFVRRHREYLALLGAAPTDAETQYGWIDPADPVGRIRHAAIYRVRRFWEKPSRDLARACWDAGAFWNTFILTSTVTTLGAIGGEAVPELNTRFARLAAFDDKPDEPWAIRQAFALAPRASFSHHVLERVPAGLVVAPMPETVTWADWGTPERVIRTLRRAGLRPNWLEALGEQPERSA